MTTQYFTSETSTCPRIVRKNCTTVKRDSCLPVLRHTVCAGQQRRKVAHQLSSRGNCLGFSRWAPVITRTSTVGGASRSRGSERSFLGKTRLGWASFEDSRVTSQGIWADLRNSPAGNLPSPLTLISTSDLLINVCDQCDVCVMPPRSWRCVSSLRKLKRTASFPILKSGDLSDSIPVLLSQPTTAS